jgi:hypothetical protein
LPGSGSINIPRGCNLNPLINPLRKLIRIDRFRHRPISYLGIFGLDLRQGIVRIERSIIRRRTSRPVRVSTVHLLFVEVPCSILTRKSRARSFTLNRCGRDSSIRIVRDVQWRDSGATGVAHYQTTLAPWKWWLGE